MTLKTFIILIGLSIVLSITAKHFERKAERQRQEYKKEQEAKETKEVEPIEE